MLCFDCKLQRLDAQRTVDLEQGTAECLLYDGAGDKGTWTRVP